MSHFQSKLKEKLIENQSKADIGLLFIIGRFAVRGYALHKRLFVSAPIRFPLYLLLGGC